MKTIFKAFCMVAGLLFLTSCGYHAGSMMHPQIKTVAVADVKNDTKQLLLASVMRGQLAEQFQVDGSLKVKSLSAADCIVYCRILKVYNESVRWDSMDGDLTYRPNEFSVTVTAEFSVLIPGRSEPLVAPRTVSASSNYQYSADPAVGMKYGMQQACYNLARRIVEYTTEAW